MQYNANQSKSTTFSKPSQIFTLWLKMKQVQNRLKLIIEDNISYPPLLHKG